MVTHIVIFTWIAGTTETQVAGFRLALDQLAADLSDLVKISHGPDLRFRDGNGDYALVATAADREGWEAYQSHPRHKAFVADFVAPIVATRLAAQI